MLKITSIPTGYFKLDGGAMFGVVPRRLWQRTHPPDENNLCTWAMRCLLIETEDRKILIDTGIGDKQNEKFFSHFEPHGTDSLLGSLHNNGLSPEDITDVFLTHLHFDHVGGAVKKDADGKLVPTFPNATYWTNQKHYDWAFNPNPREAASFLKENFVPLHEHGVLKFIPVVEGGVDWIPGIKVHFAYGHTEAMMLPEIDQGDHKVFYCADLLASHFHLGRPYVMGYDIRPLVTMQEKEWLLDRAIKENLVLFFEHDPVLEKAEITLNERGRHVVKKANTLG